jgi:hypothetical protein
VWALAWQATNPQHRPVYVAAVRREGATIDAHLLRQGHSERQIRGGGRRRLPPVPMPNSYASSILLSPVGVATDQRPPNR